MILAIFGLQVTPIFPIRFRVNGPFYSGRGFTALTELGAFMQTQFLCISVLRVASGPRVKLASCKSALNPLY